MIKQAVVLAGGKGTRLAEIIGDKPKFLSRISDKTLADIVLDELSKSGITHLLFLLGVGSEQIIFFLENSNWTDAFEIEWCVETEELGTGGALYSALEKLDERFLLVYGDVYSRGAIANFLERARFGGNALLTRASDHMGDSDLVDIDQDGNLKAIHSKPHAANLDFRNRAMTGISIWEKMAVNQLGNAIKGKKFDLDRQGVPTALSMGIKIQVIGATGVIKDSGTPERLRSVAKLESNHTKMDCAIFLDRDGVINIDHGHISSPDEISVYPDVADFLIHARRIGFKIFVVSNQPVIARGEATFESLELIHARIDSVLAEQGAYLDEYFICPHHPDSGFHGENPLLKVDCDCRKPKPGLILEAINKYEVNPLNSFMIGDRYTDFLAAKAAGVEYFNVRSIAHASDFLNFDSLQDVFNEIKGREK